jgi:hypothetical protein
MVQVGSANGVEVKNEGAKQKNSQAKMSRVLRFRLLKITKQLDLMTLQEL